MFQLVSRGNCGHLSGTLHLFLFQQMRTVKRYHISLPIDKRYKCFRSRRRLENDIASLIMTVLGSA